ncbi:ATP-binding protein [Pseudonocardia sp. TRM90224]|uniref:ATP-binding protein n=1 Tax=Pseudonocardia sp. TRM90224 TaxID=2812678 RepID=UPI001E4ED3CC|nr:AAA family ATPase [Pseudonocardia sp. TRM90224]
MATGLLERDENLEVVRSAVDAARSGAGRVVLVTGEAGIGKSSLVRALRAGLEPGLRVLAGGCDDLLAPRALGPLWDAVRGTDGPLERALAERSDGVFAAVVTELSRRATLLVVEDVHWADDATLDVLRYLARRIDTLPAVLLLTLRDDAVGADHPVRQLLGSLAGTPTTRLPLAPLSSGAVSELATSAGRDGSALHALTGGNPFYLTETLAAPPDELPASVAEAVVSRVRRLSPECVAALERLSVVPGTVDLSLAETLLGEGLVRLVEAEERGIIEVRIDGIAFRHELARRAIEAGMPRLRARTMHRAVVAALSASEHPDLERLVHHSVAADDAATVVQCAPAAGRAAARAGSHRQALAHFTVAVPHLDRLPAREQSRLLDDYAWELYIAYRFAEAVEVGREVVAHNERLDDVVAMGETTARLSRYLLMTGRLGDAQRLSERAVDLLTSTDARPSLAWAATERGAILAITGEMEAAVPELRHAGELAAGIDRPDLESLCMTYLGMARAGSGDPVGGHDEMCAGLALAVATGSHEAAARAYINIGEVRYAMGDWAGLAENCDAGLAHVTRYGLWHHSVFLELQRCLIMLRHGEWDGVESVLETLLEREAGSSVFESAVHATLGMLYTRRGNPAAGEAVSRAWRVAQELRQPLGITRAGRALVEWAWLTGNTDAAAEVARVLLPRLQPAIWSYLRGQLLRYLARAGLPAEPFDGCHEGYAAGLRGDWAGAAAIWEREGDPYEQALELADSNEVAPTLRGLAMLDDLGASANAELVRRRLRALGVTRPPRQRRETVRRNPGGLTDRQLDVLERLEAGDTNVEIAARLVLSVRTVDHHVSAILTRLGAATRREAVAIARTWKPAP